MVEWAFRKPVHTHKSSNNYCMCSLLQAWGLCRLFTCTISYRLMSLQSITIDMSSSIMDREKNESPIFDLEKYMEGYVNWPPKASQSSGKINTEYSYCGSLTPRPQTGVIHSEADYDSQCTCIYFTCLHMKADCQWNWIQTPTHIVECLNFLQKRSSYILPGVHMYNYVYTCTTVHFTSFLPPTGIVVYKYNVP